MSQATRKCTGSRPARGPSEDEADPDQRDVDAGGLGEVPPHTPASTRASGFSDRPPRASGRGPGPGAGTSTPACPTANPPADPPSTKVSDPLEDGSPWGHAGVEVPAPGPGAPAAPTPAGADP